MRKLLITASLALLLSACSSDDDVSVEPIDPVVPVEPVDPAPASVTIDQANEIRVVIGSVDPQSFAIAFTLTDADSQVVTDAGSDFEIMYLSMPSAITSAFSMPWHNASKFGCDAEESDCIDTLVEVSPGSYTFTPASQPVFNMETQTLRLSVMVAGALAQSKPEIVKPIGKHFWLPAS
ncbi:hypothetical protein [Shewanella atlantica]|uniref:Lipoprotein n=1 Tax=Shewanella atlantica TaxID=271099 RepID=A0A3S0IDJ6_9GAMM|nr:hypothetical protein [Shewanella atlantica]RTR31271.1 hypothetical protein EKG39_14505 [Shewanella atlantica]